MATPTARPPDPDHLPTVTQVADGRGTNRFDVSCSCGGFKPGRLAATERKALNGHRMHVSYRQRIEGKVPAAKTAPAAHLVGVRPANDSRGLMVSHIACDGPEVYVPPMPLHSVVLAIDIINAVVGHECPPGTPAEVSGRTG